MIMKKIIYHDELYVRALQRVSGLGNRSIRQLARIANGLEAMYSMNFKQLTALDGVMPKLAELVLSAHSEMENAQREFDYCTKNSIEMLAFNNQYYPQRLRVFDDAPVVVFWRGNKSSLQQDRTIGVVGTRAATDYGRRHTQSLIEKWQPFGPAVISGLAYGIDVAAHQAALNFQLPTIGVMGNGIDKVYPSMHRRVADEMLEMGGLLSEFPPGTKPDRQNFPMRNRIVAMLSDALVVVEAAERGGALITANMAFDYNKEVYAVPGKPSDRLSMGCNKLIAENKAILLYSPQQVVDDLRWQKSSRPRLQQGQLFLELDPLSQEIIALLSDHPKTPLEELCSKLNKRPSELLGPLLELELKGLVCSLPGNTFVIS
ncbi:MAG: DNA-protecting protein DprA [Flavobacteriales bacterium]|jgi:DNA processing protein|nr:MAG: DNA-protecting protein DprA [Flavobacteriales bacterium]